MQDFEGKLKIKDLHFTSFDFRQDNTIKGKTEVIFSFRVSYKKITAKSQIVKLGAKVQTADNRLELNISMQATAELIKEGLLDIDLCQSILCQNPVAIMFPYLRSEIVLLTSQPGLLPIQLPIIDVTTLTKDAVYED